MEVFATSFLGYIFVLLLKLFIAHVPLLQGRLGCWKVLQFCRDLKIGQGVIYLYTGGGLALSSYKIGIFYRKNQVYY